MRKKTKFKSHLSDFFIVLVCLSVCAVSLYFFWQMLNHSTVRSDKEKIATIYFKQKVAQRQFNDSVVWERLSQNSPLYDKDTIYTSDFSQAIVKFNDGTQLELNENTMLKLSYSEKGVEINVSGGEIQIDASKSKSEKELYVSMQNGTNIKMNSGSSIALKSDSSSGVNNIEVHGGSAKIETKNGESENISSGESVNEEAGAISKNPVTVTSVSKNLNLLKFDEKDIPVKLEWSLSEPAKNQKVVVQTSRKKDFSEISETFSPSSSSIEIPVSGGNLYWRVFTEEQKDKPASGKISVRKVEPVRIISPASGTEFSCRNELSSVLFSWSACDLADHFKIEVSRFPDMKNIVFSETVDGNSLAVEKLAPGEYFWRVTPFFTLNDTGYAFSSGTSAFSVVKREQINPPALLLPADGSKITYSEPKDAANSFVLQFAWKSEIQNAEYNFEISKNKEFSDVFYSEKIEKSTFLKKNLGFLSSFAIPDGTYFWRVSRNSSEPEDSSPLSNIYSFSIQKIAADKNRLVYPPENYSAELEQIQNTKFLWKIGDDYKNKSLKSIVQFSPEKDFSKIEFEQQSDGQELLLKNENFQDGTYFWRVGLELENGEKTGFSDSRTLNILKKISAPEIVFPEKNSAILTYAQKPFRFLWKKSDGADYYNVKILDENGKSVAEKSGLKENSAVFALPPEKYTLSVQAFSEETPVNPFRSSGVSKTAFSLRNPVPVSLNSPDSSAQIEGLSALKNPVVFSWQPGIDIPSKSEFVLNRIYSDGKIKKVYSVLNPDRKIEIQRLLEGNYSWQILASTADGIPLDSSKNYFSVLKIPLLQKPELLQPENDFVIGNSYLKKNKFVSFEWKKVPGATDYKFTLYQKFPDGTAKLISSVETKSTGIQIKKQNFDIGDFEWSVSAYSHASDGYEEQHSQISTGIFKIKVELPGKIRLIKPGRLYAK